nr:hypothetical protein [Tanacetum cinerariifolium]
MLPIELTNDDIRNTKAYKKYYACATREAAPKLKVSARRKKSGSDTSITPPTAITTPTTTIVVTPRLNAAAKGKQPAKAKSPSDPSESVNAQLEAEVLTRSSHSSRTSYAFIADLSEMELKKILIEKMEGNKTIQRSDEQRNLYKALKEGPFAGLDRGSKRRREGKEPESSSTPLETA